MGRNIPFFLPLPLRTVAQEYGALVEVEEVTF